MIEKIFILFFIAAVFVFAKLWTLLINKDTKASMEEKTLFKTFGYLICGSMIIMCLFSLFN